MTNATSHVRLRWTGGKPGDPFSLQIGGQEVAVAGFTLKGAAGDLPKLELNLLPLDINAEVDIDAVVSAGTERSRLEDVAAAAGEYFIWGLIAGAAATGLVVAIT